MPKDPSVEQSLCCPEREEQRQCHSLHIPGASMLERWAPFHSALLNSSDSPEPWAGNAVLLSHHISELSVKVNQSFLSLPLSHFTLKGLDGSPFGWWWTHPCVWRRVCAAGNCWAGGLAGWAAAVCSSPGTLQGAQLQGWVQHQLRCPCLWSQENPTAASTLSLLSNLDLTQTPFCF